MVDAVAVCNSFVSFILQQEERFAKKALDSLAGGERREIPKPAIESLEATEGLAKPVSYKPVLVIDARLAIDRSTA